MIKIKKITFFILFLILTIASNQYAVTGYDYFNPFEYDKDKIKYFSRNEFPWSEDEQIQAARGYLILGCLADSITLYKNQTDSKKWNELEIEYAYTLGLSGFYEEALLYLDNSRKKNPSNPGTYFYAGMIYLFAGFSDLANEMLKIAQGDNELYNKLAKKFLSENKGIGAVSFATVSSGLSKTYNLNTDTGVVVLNTYPGPSKFVTGIKNGDVILSANGKKTETVKDILNIINSSYEGASINLEIIRNGKKQNLTVRVHSGLGPYDLPEITKITKEPQQADLQFLAKALSFLYDKNYFTSAFIYRKLIEKYPGWDLLYIGSVLCLENIGAFNNATKLSQRALELTKDKETKLQMKEKLSELKSMSEKKKKSWRDEQGAKEIKEEEKNQKNFFIGFGGAQISIGGDSGFKLLLKGRVGMFVLKNTDISADITVDTSSGLILGLSGVERFYLIDDISLNSGVFLSVNTAGPTFNLGLSGGASYYLDKYTSIDLTLNIIGLPSQDINFYLGMTRYF